MNKILSIVLLFISNIIYSQSIQIISDDDFTFKSNNQSFVLFKIRVNDYTDYYPSEQVLDNHRFPLLNICKYDNVISKKWDGYINEDFYIHKRMKGGSWEKKDKLSVYEWTYLLEVKPDKEGYFFEYFILRDSSNKPLSIPVFRKIAPENNKFYNYGTIDVTINQPDREPFVKLLDDSSEKDNLINKVKVSYPKIYEAYKDKISDDKIKFFFTITTVGEINLKTTLHYWSVNDVPVEVATDKSVEVVLGTGIIINSKSGERPRTSMNFNQLHLPNNFNITYNSSWEKGETNRAYGLIISNSDENKYFFYTTTDGKSGISGTCNGSNEVCEISNENASTGKPNKKNNYRVEIRNKKATYYINNIKVGSIDLNYDLSSNCNIGFMANDKQKVRFDDLLIVEQ